MSRAHRAGRPNTARQDAAPGSGQFPTQVSHFLDSFGNCSVTRQATLQFRAAPTVLEAVGPPSLPPAPSRPGRDRTPHPAQPRTAVSLAKFLGPSVPRLTHREN